MMMKRPTNSRFNPWPMLAEQRRRAPFALHIVGMRGITLVELMVAITISLVILAVMAQIFASSRATHTVEEGLSRIQEGGRFSFDMLASDIRTAGFFGCSNVPPADPAINPSGADNAKNNIATGKLNNATIYDTTAQAGIQGYRYTGTGGNSLTTDWSPALLGNVLFNAGDIRPYSDVLIIRHATSNGVTITDTTATDGPLQIRAADASEFSVNDILMINDCKFADIFIVTAISGSGANRTIEHDTSAGRNQNATLPHKYSAGAELLRYTTAAYYVGDTQRRDKNGQFIPALFRNTWSTTAGRQREELVEGVETIQVYYGLLSTAGTRADATPDRYVPANVVNPNWLNVATVRVGLVISTAERTSRDSENTAPAGFNVLGIATDAAAPYVDNYVPPNSNDGRTRRVFSFVVNKRQPTRNPP